MKLLKVRNKNAILELLQDGVLFEKIQILKDLDQDDLTERIVHVAKKQHVSVEEAVWGNMAESRSGSSREAILGLVPLPPTWSLHDLLGKLYEKDQTPFFLLVNKVGYENNIGAIARTAFAAGVNGLIFQGDEGEFISDESVHISLGTLLRIPLVKMGTFEALHELEKNGIPTYALHMKGTPYTNKDLTGPVAFLLGAEGEGLSDTILDRTTDTLAIPMQKGIDSLNVGSSAAVLLYEKVRQEGKRFLKQ
jgi:23S rRNA (guanosine2251-2'-O)-methyltransferase